MPLSAQINPGDSVIVGKYKTVDVEFKTKVFKINYYSNCPFKQIIESAVILLGRDAPSMSEEDYLLSLNDHVFASASSIHYDGIPDNSVLTLLYNQRRRDLPRPPFIPYSEYATNCIRERVKSSESNISNSGPSMNLVNQSVPSMNSVNQSVPSMNHSVDHSIPSTNSVSQPAPSMNHSSPLSSLPLVDSTRENDLTELRDTTTSQYPPSISSSRPFDDNLSYNSLIASVAMPQDNPNLLHSIEQVPRFSMNPSLPPYNSMEPISGDSIRSISDAPVGHEEFGDDIYQDSNRSIPDEIPLGHE